MKQLIDRLAAEHILPREDLVRLIAGVTPGLSEYLFEKSRAAAQQTFGNRIYVEVEIAADGEVPLAEAHETSAQVHHAMERRFPMVKHCMVHVNPRIVASKRLP